MSGAWPDWEPALRPAPPASPVPEDNARAWIEGLLRTQRYGVLATQGGSQPYTSLLAIAANQALDVIAFATPVTTRKFKLLESCTRVSLLVDSRSQARNLMSIEAVTALGVATRALPEEPAHAKACGLLLERHPHLRGFLRAPTCAVFTIDVACYLHVARFQDVQEWSPR